MKTGICVGLLLMFATAETAAQASAGHPWSGELHWDVRARSEVVDEDGFSRDARAHTVRTRLGYLWTAASAWGVYLEGEHIEAFGNRYNSSANGKTQFPLIADPESTELNQAWVSWQNGAWRARVGRQRLMMENQRFVGSVGWRQNEQTIDAASLRWQPLDHLEASYAYLDKVHRINSDRAVNPLLRERDHRSHVMNMALRPVDGQRLVGYAYLLDDRDRPLDSSATYGLRWTGTMPLAEAQFHWALEAARQQDHGDHPETFSLWYSLVEPRIVWRGTSWKAGREQLSGNGSVGFATPLATLYAFNGWADKFLATPADGLVDYYLGVNGTLGGVGWTVGLHDFHSDRNSRRYGRELDAGLSFRPTDRWPVVVTARVADYRAKQFASDTRKYVIQLEWKGSRAWPDLE